MYSSTGTELQNLKGNVQEDNPTTKSRERSGQSCLCNPMGREIPNMNGWLKIA